MYAGGVNFTSLLFMNVYRIYILYVIHMCRGRFTSSLIHCILCFMWLGSSHLFSYKCMYTEGVNFTSLLFMNVYHIYISLLFDLFFAPLLMNWQKREEEFGEFIYACLFYFLVYAKRGERIWWVYACLFPSLCIYVLFGLCI